jgi:uncharacterized protein (DUF4213/DUF364 family)
MSAADILISIAKADGISDDDLADFVASLDHHKIADHMDEILVAASAVMQRTKDRNESLQSIDKFHVLLGWAAAAYVLYGSIRDLAGPLAKALTTKGEN